MKLHCAAYKPRFEVFLMAHVDFSGVQCGLFELIEAGKFQGHIKEVCLLESVAERVPHADGLIGNLIRIVAAGIFLAEI